MTCRRAFVLLLVLGLGGCSYEYEVRVEVIDGQIVFTSDRDWLRQRCVRKVQVIADERDDRAEAEEGDDLTRVGYGTYWAAQVGNHCENRFPVVYGARLQGETMPDHANAVLVAPKPLRRGVVYEVSTVTGATGYGGGRFVINTDGTVTNLADAR